MNYVRCPRCGLNYILPSEQLCKVCKDEIAGRKSIFDEEGFNELICPYCEKNVMGVEDIMCSQCRAKRSKSSDDV